MTDLPFEERVAEAICDMCCEYEAGQFVPADLQAVDETLAYYGLRLIDRMPPATTPPSDWIDMIAGSAGGG